MNNVDTFISWLEAFSISFNLFSSSIVLYHILGRNLSLEHKNVKVFVNKLTDTVFFLGPMC